MDVDGVSGDAMAVDGDAEFQQVFQQRYGQSGHPWAHDGSVQTHGAVKLYELLGLGLQAVPISLWAALDSTWPADPMNCGVSVTLPHEPPEVKCTGVAQQRKLRKRKPRSEMRSARRNNEGGVAGCENCEAPDDPLVVHPDFASMAIRPAGDIWAIDGINSSDWEPLVAYARHSAADAFMAQETKKMANQTKDAETLARGVGWSMTVAPAIRTANGGRSAGVAVAARNTYGLGEPKIKPSNASDTARITAAWFPGC